MFPKNEKTAWGTSAATDVRQSTKSITEIITENDFRGKPFSELCAEVKRMQDPFYLGTVTLAQLYDTAFEAKTPLIDDLLYKGTYLFVGSPKVGKSFMMAQLAYHVSKGAPLWGFNVRKATVLYFALEDDNERLQQRFYKMFGSEESKNLYLASDSKLLGSGLEQQIETFIEDHPDTGLVIIDTLKRVREDAGNDYSYAGDYNVVSRLKTIADKHKITLIIVHHTRKQHADDKFDMISGTNGLLGAADGAFVLSKKNRTENEATLEVVGRDQQDLRINLVRDTESLVWNLESVETELWKQPPEPILEMLSAFLSSAGNKWFGSPTELAEALGVDMKPNTLTQKLNVNVGRLFKEYGICYENRRTHNGRRVKLSLAERVDGDDGVDEYDSGRGV